LGERALRQILQSGRICVPHLLEHGVDPDAAWRRNEPLPIKQVPLLFDFKWLPKPQLVPSKAQQAAGACGAADSRGAEEPAAALVVAGTKRKAAEEPASKGSL
jgi:hypothetical protein